jgi:signal transduction histidine kinase/CheY-like chemotaxis protein/HAMP domain-containing protein
MDSEEFGKPANNFASVLRDVILPCNTTVPQRMSSFFSLRARLVGTVFVAIAPAWVVMYLIARHTGTELWWPGFVVGCLALVAAWLGGERFILRQVRSLSDATQKLAAGDMTSRTGLTREKGEFGELARTFDKMAAFLEQRGQEREQGEKTLLNRSFQQTVVSALGQFALLNNDLPSLLNQAAMFAAQTLEVEYCQILELLPDQQTFLMQAGVGWKDGAVGQATMPADPTTQAGFTLAAGEPVVVENLQREGRFHGSSFLLEHGVVSGVTVAISGHGQAFGVLGAHTTHRRKFTEDEVHFLLAIATVLAMGIARTRAEAKLQKLAAFTQLNPTPAMELAADGAITYFNDAALMLAQAIGRDHPRGILPSNIRDVVRNCLGAERGLIRLETQLEGRTLSWVFHPVRESKVVHGYVEDITGRLSLEAQLRQSQKMESVGQLAAGVAHDFNNMLTIIQGHAGMLMVKPNLPAELVESTQAVYFAAERAAGLTRQLLMFSRKTMMQPKELDLREVVSHMGKMLERLLGETITLKFQPPAEMPLVQADTGMVEQVIMNLAVNARDAMPKGGTLAIATDAVSIDEAYRRTHPESRTGNFVCLRVTDTGSGMDALTRSRIFEPFFTTKEVGKGTGLGLATVYGITKQHDGWIEVESEPGKGSRFSVFFPATSEPVQAKSGDTKLDTDFTGGKETILIVEDEPVLRQMAQVILQDCGYHTLEASSGREALKVWEKHRNSIDLVLTDVVMPEGVSGMDLANKLLTTKPRLKIVFASGYSMDEVNTSFVRKGHAGFLQKPYTHVTLARAIRDCLDKK